MFELNFKSLNLNLIISLFFVVLLISGAGAFFLLNKFFDRLLPAVHTQQTFSSKIIVLNGASSSGKSTIATALQQRLAEPFMHVGIDKMIGMMPAKFNNWTGDGGPVMGFSWTVTKQGDDEQVANLQMGPLAEQVNDSLKKIAVAMAKAGHNLILDLVSFNTADFASWKEHLAPFKVIYVGLKINDATLAKREKERGDRIYGSAVAGNQLVHLGKHYDLELDMDAISLDDNVAKIIQTLKKASL